MSDSVNNGAASEPETVTSYSVAEDGVALIRLERPRSRNAINTQMLSELLEHLAVEVHFFGKLGGLATLAEEIEDAANQAHDITFWMARTIRPNSLFSAASCLRPAAVSL